jgi:hypothetical protein
MKVRGKVIDERGTPVGGAKVNILEGETKIGGMTSSPDGEFVFSNEGDYTGSSLKVQVKAAGFKPLDRSIRSEGESDLRLQLQADQPPLTPSPPHAPELVSITGKVVDETNQPVKAAKIGFFDGHTEIAGTDSAGDGSFGISIEIEPTGRGLRIKVSAAGFKSLEKSIRAEGESDLRLQLQADRPAQPPPIPSPPTAPELVSQPPRRWWIIFLVALCIITAVAVRLCYVPAQKVLVPPLVGRTAEQAITILSQVPLKAKEEFLLVPSVSDVVIKQSPLPNTKVDPGSTVTISVARHISLPTPLPPHLVSPAH